MKNYNIDINKNISLNIKRNIKPIHKRYGICKVITIGFIIGAILDLIIPCTFGLIAKFLKKYGKTIFELRYNEIKNKYIKMLINFII